MKRTVLIFAILALVLALPAVAWSPFERDGDKPRAEINSAKHNAATQMTAHLVYADGHNIPGPVTVTLEAGKRYYVAGECTGERHGAWQPVVVEVADIE